MPLSVHLVIHKIKRRKENGINTQQGPFEGQTDKAGANARTPYGSRRGIWPQGFDLKAMRKRLPKDAYKNLPIQFAKASGLILK